MASILIVDDLISIHEMLEAVIQPTGHKTAFATDGEKALVRYKAEKYDLVLCDIDMKPMDGITLLKQLKIYDPGAVVVIMTAYASTESAIQALKYGAFDYLQKPFKVDELMQALKRSLEFKRIITERDSLGATPAVKTGDFEARLVGGSPKIKRLITQLKKLATAHTPILVSGETGTGHEIAAELLHAAQYAAEAPLVRIDCRLSSAASMRTGLLGENGAGGTWVQQARGGTLFLTHLQCLPPEAQAEFISVLRNNAHAFRLVCATEEDLEKLAESGGFNEELFYRVAALPVEMPSLRERTEDIPALLKSVAAKISNPQFDARQVEFTEDALATLRAYHWPGNLDEFTQVISQLITTTETRVITSAQLPLRVQDMKQWPSLADYLAGQEKQYIARVLNACQGDKARAAKALGIDPLRFG
ncbi:Transcriptional regulatory protein ZraR [Lacunisphaera limnophila]|uniref:Transcriptional regulatory protein ZraR n=1 Tax=Lacunisphaera limnophila TaxID=1838286 RepID=A0A1D8AS99_9BACT|nr:response regulator [Lacunisphaera limnophila]AOS43771.1 Transcriptional regulatory protein ZraR [Lacunisphaera limnophila]